MTTRAAQRGEPLVVLGIVLGAWIVLRAVLWQTPFPEPQQLQTAPEDAVFATLQGSFADPRSGPKVEPRSAIPQAKAQNANLVRPPADEAVPAEMAAAPPPDPVPLPLDPVPARVEPAPPKPIAPQPMPPRSAAGHSLMLMAGFANLELPPELARYLAPRLKPAPAAIPFLPATAMTGMSGTDRWSADAWLLLREDSTTAATSGRGSYGRSQLGAVLRYRLWPASPHRPTAYLRASQALAGARESEAALGFAARPIPGLPVVAAAELRLTHANGTERARPAVYAVTELPPIKLPAGFAAEAYLQAGYVGGTFATGFVDGQVRAERKLFDLGSAELRGGAACGAGHRKAHRGSISGPARP